MKKIIVKKLDGSDRAGSTFESELEMQSWIDSCIEKNKWGKKAGFYPLSQLSEAELATEISRVVMDEKGELLQDPQVEIPAQYTIEIVDITEEHNEELLVQEGIKAQDLGKRVMGKVYAINKKKLLSGQMTEMQFESLMDEPKIIKIQTHLLNGSLQRAKKLISQLPAELASDLEKESLINNL